MCVARPCHAYGAQAPNARKWKGVARNMLALPIIIMETSHRIGNGGIMESFHAFHETGDMIMRRLPLYLYLPVALGPFLMLVRGFLFLVDDATWSTASLRRTRGLGRITCIFLDFKHVIIRGMRKSQVATRVRNMVPKVDEFWVRTQIMTCIIRQIANF